jgi:hypothetical protein
MYASCSSSSSNLNRSRKYFCFTSWSDSDGSRCRMRVIISRESGSCGRWFQRTNWAEVEFVVSGDFNDLSGCCGGNLRRKFPRVSRTEKLGATQLWPDYGFDHASLARFSSRSLSGCYTGRVFSRQGNGSNSRHAVCFVCPAMAPDKRNAFVPRYGGQLLGLSIPKRRLMPSASLMLIA